MLRKNALKMTQNYDNFADNNFYIENNLLINTFLNVLKKKKK